MAREGRLATGLALGVPGAGAEVGAGVGGAVAAFGAIATAMLVTLMATPAVAIAVLSLARNPVGLDAAAMKVPRLLTWVDVAATAV